MRVSIPPYITANISIIIRKWSLQSLGHDGRNRSLDGHCPRQCEREEGRQLRTEASLVEFDECEVRLSGDKTAIPRRRVIPMHTHMLVEVIMSTELLATSRLGALVS